MSRVSDRNEKNTGLHRSALQKHRITVNPFYGVRSAKDNPEVSAMKNHILMLLACVIPLILIFLLPSIGIGTSGLSLLLLLIGCFVVHLFMMRCFGKNSDQDKEGGTHDVH